MLTFAIDFHAPLLYGLRSPTGGWGRGLQNLALILGEAGHQVDVYTPAPAEIAYSYKGVQFLDCADRKGTRTYDIVLWNGWESDEPLRLGRAYIYLEFFRNWEQRQNQIEFLKQDNVIVGFPFQSSSSFFLDKNCLFRDKSVLCPYPLYHESELRPSNYSAGEWAISLKPYQFPHRFEVNFNNSRVLVNQLCRKYQKHMTKFPEGQQAYDKVWHAMLGLQLLFPFSPSGSSLEAVVSGVVPLPVFRGEDHVQTHLPLGESSKRAGTYLEYPLDPQVLSNVVQFLVETPDNYARTLAIYRDELKPNSYNFALRAIEALGSSLL